ncbi:hypothetical protein [Nitrosomonas sp. Nm58]|uniref:hypothetical protein n=1 Tax=Nitrosomonas sp. Nm58 TaxID=200126 RepID=UPI000B8458B6|nr:hypothetical protein [Nitrosomonas sp. Nm58]
MPPSFLLDIAPENHTKLRFEATERHVPAAYKMMTDSVALRELPVKYDKTISAVRGSFYLPPVAAQAAKRVHNRSDRTQVPLEDFFPAFVPSFFNQLRAPTSTSGFDISGNVRLISASIIRS